MHVRQTLAAALSVFSLACTTSERAIAVDVRSDFVAGNEVVAVRCTLSGRQQTNFIGDGDLLAGVRACRFSDASLSSGSVHDLAIELLGPRAERVAQRDVRVLAHDGVALATVLMTRDCANVDCSNAAGLRTCFRGSCVDPACSDERPELCGEAECAVASDCRGTPICGTYSCVSGACVVDAREACPRDEWCSTEGCRPKEATMAPALTCPLDCGEHGRCALQRDAGEAWVAFCACNAGYEDIDGSCVYDSRVLIGASAGTQRIATVGINPTLPYACPWPAVLTGLYTEYDVHNRMTGFDLHCRALDSQPSGDVVAVGNVIRAAGYRGMSWDVDYVQNLDCPDGSIMTGVRAFTGAFEPGPDDGIVLDRVELACAQLRQGASGLVSSEPQYVVQELRGSRGLLDNQQIQQSIACPPGAAIAALSTSGGGHADHLDLYCIQLVLGSR